MTVPADDQFECAIMWLESNEGGGAEGEACHAGEKPWAFNIDRFSAGLDELSRKDQRNQLKVLAVLAQAKLFSVFEATENAVIAATMTTVMKSGWVADVGGGYPWTNIELTDAGREALGHGEKP